MAVMVRLLPNDGVGIESAASLIDRSATTLSPTITGASFLTASFKTAFVSPILPVDGVSTLLLLLIGKTSTFDGIAVLDDCLNLSVVTPVPSGGFLFSLGFFVPLIFLLKTN